MLTAIKRKVSHSGLTVDLAVILFNVVESQDKQIRELANEVYRLKHLYERSGSKEH